MLTMAKTAFGTVLHDLCRPLLGQQAGCTDGDLLECFITRRDEAAFAGLVRRHGPMVLGVCRRVLQNEADAEDAFQATFLVLVHKAASIRPREMVSNWLYGVAHSTALKARAMRTKRLAKEREAAARPKPEGSAETWEHLSALLDQELKGLPDNYRAAIILCDLEGKSIKEAAQQFGCPQGTVGTRLARGRTLLARRLARRGLAVSGGMIVTALAQQAVAAEVPSLLLSSTIKAALVVAAGQSVATGLISAKVGILTQGVLKTMLLTKLKIALAVLSAIVVLAAGTTFVTVPARAVPPQPLVKAARPDTQAEAPKEKPKGDKEEANTELKKAVAELLRSHALKDEEDLKCVKPPYAAARQDWWTLINKGRDLGGAAELSTNAVFRWNKGGLKHWSSIYGAPGPTLALLMPTVAPLQAVEIEGDKDLLRERFDVDFIVREGAPTDKIVASLEKILRTEFALPVKLTFREVERKVYVASGKYRFVPVNDRSDNRIELYGKKLVDPKLGGRGSGDFAVFLRSAGAFMSKRIVAGKIEDAPHGQLQWHENYLAAFTEAEVQGARDPESVLKHLSEQTGLTFKEEAQSVRVLFVERKE
jgi:RNA polymerase sigma factor (sigma-70 family)